MILSVRFLKLSDLLICFPPDVCLGVSDVAAVSLTRVLFSACSCCCHRFFLFDFWLIFLLVDLSVFVKMVFKTNVFISSGCRLLETTFCPATHTSSCCSCMHRLLHCYASLHSSVAPFILFYFLPHSVLYLHNIYWHIFQFSESTFCYFKYSIEFLQWI